MKEFEVRVEAELPATPEEVWDALTLNTAAWVWEVSYEPRVGGAEKGLAGGTVTAWEPPHHLATRAERPDGWWNNLDTVLEPSAGGTQMRYVHNSVTPEETYDVELDACRKHTALYYHNLAEYLRHFKGRKATYAEADGPEGSARPGTFARLRRALGLAKGASVGDRVRLEPDGARADRGRRRLRDIRVRGRADRRRAVPALRARRVRLAGRRRYPSVRRARGRRADERGVAGLVG